MIIMLRGHIRNSFNDTQLYNLIKQISLKNSIKIYIHTWNIIQTNVSWRNIKRIGVHVNESKIKNYFKDLSDNIVEIIIDDDKNVQLEGNTQGVISLTQCPKVGWKNMWYGKKRIIDVIKNDIIDVDEPIINLRFDIFSNSCPLSHDFIIRFIERNKNNITKIIFTSNQETTGIDNLYLGDFNSMFNLIYHFHYNLDFILPKHHVGNQEFVVFRENMAMNN